MAKTYSRNHTVSAGYIRRFASNRRVTVHHVTRGVFDTGSRAVGFQNDFWGSEDLSREVEEAFDKCENPVLQMLRDLPRRWPLATTDRAAVAQFLAIHVIRTPAYGAFVRRAGKHAREDAVRDVAAQHGLMEDEISTRATEILSGQRNHVRTLLGQVGRIASMFSNMQWALVQFDHDHLITSDQPVVMLPLVQATISPASSVPIYGFSKIMEARFTLDPRQVLLMTWADAPDIASLLSGTYSQACSINCAIRAQSLEEWVCRPQTTPPFHAPPILTPSIYAISTELLAGYTVQSALQSRRRAESDRLISRIIEENAPRDRMTWITVT
jgi:uncharacterized protein DUF4238